MNIPQLDSCRFITLANIKNRIAEDNFQYKSVRVLGRVKSLANEQGLTEIEQEGVDFPVNTF